MSKISNISKSIGVLGLAAFTSVSFFGCKDETAASYEEIEAELDTWANDVVKIREEFAEKYNKATDQFIKEHGGKVPKDVFTQKFKDACIELDKQDRVHDAEIDKKYQEARAKIGQDRNAVNKKEAEDRHDNGQARRTPRVKAARNLRSSAAVRCHAAAEGVDLPFLAKPNPEFRAKAAGLPVNDIIAAEQSILELVMQVTDTFTSQMINFRKGVQGKNNFNTPAACKAKCETIHQEQISDLKKMGGSEPAFVKVREQNKADYDLIQHFLDRVYARCKHVADGKYGALLEVAASQDLQAQAHHHTLGRSRKHSHQALELDQDPSSEHSRVSGVNHILD